MAEPSNDFLPSAPLENLRLRDELLRKLRSFFHDRGFFEVTTPTLSRDTVVDRHLDPYAAYPYDHTDASSQFLQTSPEFHMKRLLVAGAEAIFQVCPAYRVGERGPLHNPEFTIVEWYRQGDDMSAGMALLSELLAQMLGCATASVVSYREAFQTHVQLDPLTADLASLHDAVGSTRDGRVAGPPQLDRDGCLEWLFADRVQPHLQQPTIIYDYPASQAALAVIRQVGVEPPVAERFELFFRGVELANGYHELLDANELAQRIAENNRLRRKDGKSPLPQSSRLIAAMHHGLPPCTGVALGFDRLAMLAVDCTSIDEIIAFSADRA